MLLNKNAKKLPRVIKKLKERLKTRCHCMGTGQSGTGKWNGQKVPLEAKSEDVCRRCGSDTVWQTVPYTGNSSGNQKSLVTDVKFTNMCTQQFDAFLKSKKQLFAFLAHNT